MIKNKTPSVSPGGFLARDVTTLVRAKIVAGKPELCAGKGAGQTTARPAVQPVRRRQFIAGEPLGSSWHA